jgi:amidase
MQEVAVAVTPPSNEEIAAIAERYGLGLGPRDLGEYRELIVGALAGRRVAVKDNIAVAGVPMMNGSATVEGFLPRRDATVVTRLLSAGATIAGKAVCEELCFDGGSHTSRTGSVRNPWDRSKSTGGSSSGSAALVASGAVDMALGGTRRARSGYQARSAARWGTSPPTGSCRTPGPSPSRTPSTTSAPSPRPSATPR